MGVSVRTGNGKEYAGCEGMGGFADIGCYFGLYH